MKRRLDIALGLVHRRRSCSSTSRPRASTPRRARRCGRSSAPRARETLTILLTTHYLEEADQLADALAIVSRGKIVVEGQPEELKRELRGEAVIVELAASTRRPGGGVRGSRRPRGAAGRPPPAHARRERARAIPGILRCSRAPGSASSRSPRTGRRSTTSTSTTRAANSQPTRRRMTAARHTWYMILRQGGT
jgi:ABC-2 type transport system ATP-binding protein